MVDQPYYIEKAATLEETPLQFIAHYQESQGFGTMAYAHIHDYIEILYALSGKFKILLNNKEYFFGEGDIVIINSNEIHNVIALHPGLNKYMVIKFMPDMLYTTSQSFFEIKYVMPFILNESTHQKIFKKEDIEEIAIPQIIHSIYQEYTEKRYGYELAIRANIFNLFLFILRSWKSKNIDLNIHQDINKDIINRLNSVLDHINSNYHEAITAMDMANRCHLSFSYFSRVFKKIMKKNFKDYLNFVRISKAEKLLCSSSLNITEIALMVGFSTSSYFIYLFKEYKGISPKQFRKKYMEM